MTSKNRACRVIDELGPTGAHYVAVKRTALLAIVLLASCSKSPTAPTSPPIVVVQPPAVVVTPPIVTPPPVVTTPPPNPLLSDPRFSLSFYRQFALDGYESQTLRLLRRQREAPRIYLRTIHDVTRAPIDALSLSQTAAALINTAASLTGVFGLAGLEQGTATHDGEPGWITVHFADDPERKFCGRGDIGGFWLELYTNTSGCRCAGGPVVRPRTVKHELGHVLGFYHTGNADDLMSGLPDGRCDQSPSEREIFHAKVAYGQAIGSLDPK
jgi:hypothetical protein